MGTRGKGVLSVVAPLCSYVGTYVNLIRMQFVLSNVKMIHICLFKQGLV